MGATGCRGGKRNLGEVSIRQGVCGRTWSQLRSSERCLFCADPMCLKRPIKFLLRFVHPRILWPDVTQSQICSGNVFRGDWKALAAAELTMFALIRNDGFWWEWKAGGAGSRELCHRAMTSVKFTAVPSNSVGMSWSDYKCILWAPRNDANRVLFQPPAHGRGAEMGKTWIRFIVWKHFISYSFILITD